MQRTFAITATLLMVSVAQGVDIQAVLESRRQDTVQKEAARFTEARGHGPPWRMQES